MSETAMFVAFELVCRDGEDLRRAKASGDLKVPEHVQGAFKDFLGRGHQVVMVYFCQEGSHVAFAWEDALWALARIRACEPKVGSMILDSASRPDDVNDMKRRLGLKSRQITLVVPSRGVPWEAAMSHAGVPLQNTITL